MDELEAELSMLPPMVQVGDHSLNLHTQAVDAGVRVELRHPNVGAKTYRVMAGDVVADAAEVIRWLELVAPSVWGRLDAERRVTLRSLGYRA